MEQLLKELKDLTLEQKTEIAEIKAKLHQELLGVNQENHERVEEIQSAELMEKTTLRELLEKMAFNLNSMSSRLELLENKFSSSRAAGNETVSGQSGPSKSTFFDEISGRDIRALTLADELAFLRKQMENIGLDGRDAVNSELDMLKAAQTENSTLISIYIENCLDIELGNLVYNFSSKPCSMVLQPIIASQTSTLLQCLFSNSKIDLYWSYELRNENLRFVIRFNLKNGYIGFAFVPEWLILSRNTTALASSHRTTSKIYGYYAETQKAMAVVRHQSIHAKFSYDKVTKGFDLSITFAKIAAGTDAHKTLDAGNTPREMVDGNTLLGKTTLNYLHYSLRNSGVVLEISNYLNVSLSGILMHLEDGQSNFVHTDFVNSWNREVLVFQLDMLKQVKGCLVTFQIGTTDLQLAIAFQLFNNGNKFAVAFVPSSELTDDNLLQILTDDNNWSTNMDHKFVRAQEGEQVIETRNIQACASMTDGMKALIKVAIKTF